MIGDFVVVTLTGLCDLAETRSMPSTVFGNCWAIAAAMRCAW